MCFPVLYSTLSTTCFTASPTSVYFSVVHLSHQLARRGTGPSLVREWPSSASIFIIATYTIITDEHRSGDQCIQQAWVWSTMVELLLYVLRLNDMLGSNDVVT